MLRLVGALKDLECAGAIVFDRAGNEVCVVGDIESVRPSGLFRSLFGGPLQLSRLRASLTGQLLPRIWNQAPVKCFVSTLPDDRLYAVFTTKPLDAFSAYELSLRVAESVDAILGSGSEGN